MFSKLCVRQSLYVAYWPHSFLFVKNKNKSKQLTTNILDVCIVTISKERVVNADPTHYHHLNMHFGY